MLILLVFLSFFFPIFSLPNEKENAIWFREGSKIAVCCSIQPKPNDEALILNVNDRRFVTMIITSSNVRRIDARDSETIKQLPYWQNDPLDKPGNSLCVHNTDEAYSSPQKRDQVLCRLVADLGLGKIVQEEQFTINTYSPPTIHTSPGVVTVVEGETAVLTCNATGSPGLHLKWRPKNSDTVLNEVKLTNGEASTGQLDLVVENVQSNQHGNVYVCEAGTSYPTNVAPVTTEVVLEVALRPTINTSSSTIYTDLNVREEVNITVTGYPVPHVQCESLEVDEGREIATKPQGGVFQYRVTIPRMEPTNLRRYLCEAENTVGRATLPLEFTVAPSSPVVLSPSQTKYANYYLLKWKTHSGAPLVNVTLNIDEYFNDESSGSLYPRAVQNKTTAGQQIQTIPLGPHELDRMKADIWPSPDQSTVHGQAQDRERTVWHHLTNLTANTEHRLTVIVCNAYACGESEPYIFHTNDDQLVDTKILHLSPRDAELLAGDSFLTTNPGSNARQTVRFRATDMFFTVICLPFLLKYTNGIVW